MRWAQAAGRGTAHRNGPEAAAAGAGPLRSHQPLSAAFPQFRRCLMLVVDTGLEPQSGRRRSVEEILADYPQLLVEDVRAAVEFACAAVSERHDPLRTPA